MNWIVVILLLLNHSLLSAQSKTIKLDFSNSKRDQKSIKAKVLKPGDPRLSNSNLKKAEDDQQQDSPKINLTNKETGATVKSHVLKSGVVISTAKLKPKRKMIFLPGTLDFKFKKAEWDFEWQKIEDELKK